MAQTNVIPFPEPKQDGNSIIPLAKNPWYIQILKWGLYFGLMLVRRFLTFGVLIFCNVGNNLFAIACNLLHFTFRLFAGFALFMGLAYAVIVWFLVSAAKTPADPHIWDYLRRFEIGLLMVFTAGIALDLALSLGKGWLYAKCEKARPLIRKGLA